MQANLLSGPASDIRKRNVLANVRIASPCPMNWERMSGDDRVRHCAECKLNVYNFSAMTEQEIEELLLRSEGRVCGRFYRRKDGTILTKDCPRGLRAAVDRLTRIAGATLSLLMSVGIAVAQTPSPRLDKNNASNNQSQKNDSETTIRVTDDSGAPLGKAIVTLRRKPKESGIIGITNSKGEARFSGLAEDSYIVSVVHPNFQLFKKTIDLNHGQTVHLRDTLRDSVGEETLGVIEPVSDLIERDPIANPTFTSEEIDRLL